MKAKNILRYIAAFSSAALSLASCEEMEDFQKTIDAAPALAYVYPLNGNTFSTVVVHRNGISSGSFHTEFQPCCNTTKHGEMTVNVSYDADLVEVYNEANGTDYEVLPPEYVKLTNSAVKIASDAMSARDTVKMDLDAEKGDLTKLTARSYLAPFKITSDGMPTSSRLGNIWFIVNTETNLIRPISSQDDMTGFPASGISSWTAESADSDTPANMFDGDFYTGAYFRDRTTLVIDMKKTLLVTGLKMYSAEPNSMTIEYSEDGLVWEQAGTAQKGEFIFTGNSTRLADFYLALYDSVKARYLRLSLVFNEYATPRINEFSAYVVDGAGMSVYTVTGTDNVVSGKIVHIKGSGSSSDFSESFPVMVTKASEKGYTVTASVDNSLVAAFNTAHGTSYSAMPEENVDIENASLSIEAGKKSSSEEVTVSLTGDLSGLDDADGYLIPVKLSASGAETSASRGVVYAVIKPESKLIRPIETPDDMLGFPAGDRTGWTADCGNYAKLFDGRSSSGVMFEEYDNVLTVNMAEPRIVTGLKINGYGMSEVSFEYSLDGEEWISIGNADESDVVNEASNYRSGDYYVAFGAALEMQYLRMKFNLEGWYQWLYEFNTYELESFDPTVYALCGTDNVLTGKIVHHSVNGSSADVDAQFSVRATTTDGWSVQATAVPQLVNYYNSTHNTNYAALDASYIRISGSPCEIPAGFSESEDVISVTVEGDVSALTDENGYLIPVRLSAEGAQTSMSRGIVYVVISVEESKVLFRDNFSIDSIEGSQVEDRSGWKITEYDKDIASGSYDNLLDGNTTTYVKPNGYGVSFTLDMGREYDMTGFVISMRTDKEKGTLNGITIQASLDGTTWNDLGFVTIHQNTVVNSGYSSYVSFFGSMKVRHLKIAAYYGQNEGTAEFTIYAK